MGSEHADYSFQSCSQCVYFLLGVVECKGGAYSPFDSEPVDERFGAVMSGSYRDAESVEQCPDVEMVNATDIKGYGGVSVFSFRMSVYLYVVNLSEPL